MWTLFLRLLPLLLSLNWLILLLLEYYPDLASQKAKVTHGIARKGLEKRGI